MSDLQGRAKEIFLKALNQTGDWEAFVAGACGGDEALQQRVEALLDAHRGAGEFLPPSNIDATIDSGGPTPDEMTRSQPAAEPKPSSQIGPYKLLEEIGEGGMGTVWVAQQSEPIKRKVAIKLIKAGMDSQQVLARFEAERQALAMMDHPNIARVVDAGMTEKGRPYFAMEYVKGVPLTEYCDQRKLSVKDRLELFLPICNAVQHAHQKGIIHRDLKPSNILICLYDGKPVPKVIDFGLAKAMHQSLTDLTLHTSHGMMVGTPLYMSPEQAESNNLDIDTRTDVYSLGVILYELLTGSTPLEKAQFKQAAMNEILRLIKEVEAPKPSSRLSGSASLPSVAAQRSIDPAQLTRRVTGDLDWVVMKALEKERGRHYETANGLSEDIRRHLSDEPVSASPPSAKYRMQKFVKRNKGPVLAASLLLVSLIAGIGGTTWGLIESNRQAEKVIDESNKKDIALLAETAARERAQLQTKRATEAEMQAKAANAKAQQRAVQLEKSNDVISGIFRDFDINLAKQSDEPLEAQLAQRLVEAAEQLEGDVLGEPLDVARLQDQLGQSLVALGFSHEAVALHEKSLATHTKTLGLEDTHTIDSMFNLAMAYGGVGKLNKKLSLLEQAVEVSKAMFGMENTRTLELMGILAGAYTTAGRRDKRDQGLMLLDQTISLKESMFGPDDASAVGTMCSLAAAYVAAGQWDKALPLYEKALKLSESEYGSKHVRTLGVRYGLARLYLGSGQWEKSQQLTDELLKLAKSELGTKHPKTWDLMSLLGKIYQVTEQFDKSLSIFKQVLELQEAKYGTGHPLTLSATGNLASAYGYSGQRERAVTVLKKLLKLTETELGAKHSKSLTIKVNLTTEYILLGKLHEALHLLEPTFEIMKSEFELQHPMTLICMKNLAVTYYRTGQSDKSLPLYEELLKMQKQMYGDQHIETLQSMFSLGVHYSEAGRHSEAIPLLKEVYECDWGSSQPWAKMGLIEAYLLAKRFDPAIAIMNESDGASPLHAYWHALALLATDDEPGYRQILGRMRTRFAKDENPVTRYWLMWTTILQPIPTDEMETASKLAQPLLLPESPDILVLAGAATLLRSGKVSDAIKRLEDLQRASEAAEQKPMKYSKAYLWYFLSMAHQKQGNEQLAREWLERANKFVKDEAASGRPVSWNRRETYRVLRTEAEGPFLSER